MTKFNNLGITIARPTSEAFDVALAKAASIADAQPPRLVAVAREITADHELSAAEYERLLGVARADLKIGPISTGSVDTFDVRVLEALLARPGLRIHPQARARIEADVAAAREALERGAIRSGAFAGSDGAIHELCQGKIDVAFDDFIAKMRPEDWSPNLAEYRGGEVREISRAKDGRGHEIVRQQERMQLGSLPNVLDMTKNTVVDKGPTAARVTWQVVHSDATPATFFLSTVQRDDGYIEFAKTADGKVLVTTRSAHLIRTPISAVAGAVAGRVTGELTARQLKGYFVAVIERYRAIAAGSVPVKAVDRP
ncbi:MAG: hypothetical protein HY903_21710 [Deltaproteobacteria bacterium]|nr:hypothetical protein [Deltaproteobacteria bacterium]